MSEKYKSVPDDTLGTLLQTVIFANTAHGKQVRKFDNVPYITHLLSVASKVKHLGEPAISAAILHDVLEDTSVKYEELERKFGTVIADLVVELTDPPLSAGNRATRKEMTRERFKTASTMAKSIKCADILDNMDSIITHDPDFAKVFMKEISLLLPQLVGADQNLLLEVVNKVNEYKRVNNA